MKREERSVYVLRGENRRGDIGWCNGFVVRAEGDVRELVRSGGLGDL